MRIGIVNTSKHQTPRYKTPGSSGVDICANIDEEILIERKCYKILSISINLYNIRILWIFTCFGVIFTMYFVY